MSKDPVILSYEECLLRKSDVELLQGPFWLNDNVISFYFEYLRNIFREAPHVLFISPEVTQCIKIIPSSQMNVFLEPLDAANKRFIFFALNDNERPQTVGGTHWSLLLFSRPDQSVYHYDSSQGSNSDQAHAFAMKVFNFFNLHGQFKEEVCLQQNNGYDCGIYLVSNAEHLARHLVTYNTLKGYNNFNSDLRGSVVTMRRQIVEVIERLRMRHN